MLEMGSQVCCAFDVDAAWRRCWVLEFCAGSLLESMKIKMQFLWRVLMLQQNELYIMNIYIYFGPNFGEAIFIPRSNTGYQFSSVKRDRILSLLYV